MKNSLLSNFILNTAKDLAAKQQSEMVTPEHVLLCLFSEGHVYDGLNDLIDMDIVLLSLRDYLASLPTKTTGQPEESALYKEMMKNAETIADGAGLDEIKGSSLYLASISIDESYAQFFFDDYEEDLLAEIATRLDDIEEECENGAMPKSVQSAISQMMQGIQPEDKTSVDDLVVCLNNRETTPVIGRQDILDRTIQILCRFNKNNPIHVGEPGVGKTAIIDGLSKMIDEGNVPDKLKDATLYSLNIGDLMAGTQYRGDLEARIKKVLKKLEKDKNPILYIDEIHNIVGTGSGSNGTMDISNMLKTHLTNGKIKFIGATTEEEYKKVFSKDKALSRRFNKIDVKEPSVEESIQILDGLKSYYEEFHQVVYTDAAIKAAVELSDKYINDKFLPDKAIDIIDEAGANKSSHNNNNHVIDKTDIEEILSTVCKIPKETVESDEVDKLKTLDSEIKASLYGQDEAVDGIVRAIKISRAGLIDDNKPVASLLMVGPTGVGKTELAKTLAETLNIELVKFDMSEYMDKTSVNKLIGASSGYVGYEEGGMLVDSIRKNPHCVLLLDEIEKAHPDVFNILLQVMDDAVLTDNQGRKADFRNVIILMTSNAGAREVGKSTIGFGDKTIDASNMKESVNDIFSPEFRNRLSGTVVFNPMDKNMATLITKRQLNILSDKMKNVKLTFTDAAIDYISEKGYSDKQFGGRSIKRVIENELKPLFVDELLFGKLKNGGRCKVDYNNGFKLACVATKTTIKIKPKTPEKIEA